MALVSAGIFEIGRMPAKRPGLDEFAAPLNSAEVTSWVSAIWSERSKTVTACLPANASTSSASGKGCSSFTETRPTLSPCRRR